MELLCTVTECALKGCELLLRTVCSAVSIAISPIEPPRQNPRAAWGPFGLIVDPDGATVVVDADGAQTVGSLDAHVCEAYLQHNCEMKVG